MYTDLWTAGSPVTTGLPLTPTKVGHSESEGSSVTFDTSRGFLDTPPPPAPVPQQRGPRKRSSLTPSTKTPINPVEPVFTKIQASAPKRPGRRRKSALANLESSRSVDYVELERKTIKYEPVPRASSAQPHHPPQKAQAPIPIASMASHSAVPPLPRISPAPPGLQFAKAFQQMVQQQQTVDPVKSSPQQMRAPIPPPPPLGHLPSLSSSSTTAHKRDRSASVPTLASQTIPILANTVNPMDLMNKSTRSQVTELKRRKLTQESFEQLKELISPEFCEPKASRAVILAGAVDYITHLQKGIAELKKMIENFRKSSIKKATSEGIDTGATENGE